MIIKAPPFTAFMIVVTKINHDLSRFLRYRSGRTGSTWDLVMIVVLWLWLVFAAMPELADFLMYS